MAHAEHAYKLIFCKQVAYEQIGKTRRREHPSIRAHAPVIARGHVQVYVRVIEALGGPCRVGTICLVSLRHDAKTTVCEHARTSHGARKRIDDRAKPGVVVDVGTQLGIKARMAHVIRLHAVVHVLQRFGAAHVDDRKPRFERSLCRIFAEAHAYDIVQPAVRAQAHVVGNEDHMPARVESLVVEHGKVNAQSARERMAVDTVELLLEQVAHGIAVKLHGYSPLIMQRAPCLCSAFVIMLYQCFQGGVRQATNRSGAD